VKSYLGGADEKNKSGAMKTVSFPPAKDAIVNPDCATIQ